MAIDLDEYRALKKQAEDAKAAADKAAGALEQLMGELSGTYGCASIAEGEALLQTYEQEAAALEAAYRAEMDKFKAEWGEYLNGQNDGGQKG